MAVDYHQRKRALGGAGGDKHVDFWAGRKGLGPVMAGAVLATLPPLFVFMLLQRQFLSGFAFSTEK